MARYKDIEPIIDFIEKGLNNPDKSKAFGHDAIEILTEIEYAPTADVVETKRISEILAVLFENNIVEKYIPNTANAGSWEDFLRKACSGEYGMLR